MANQTGKALIVTRAQLARLLAIVPDRVTKLVAEGMPVHTTGGGRGRETRIDLATALPWLWQRKTGSFDDARSRYYTARADAEEFDLRVASGKVLDADAAGRAWCDLCTIVRVRLLAVPSKVKGRRHELGLEVIATIDDEIRDALTELADLPAERWEQLRATLRTTRKTA